MSRKMIIVWVILGVLLVGGIIYMFSRSEDTPRPAAPTPSAEPTVPPAVERAPGEGEPGSVIREGFTVVEGSRLVEEPVAEESDIISGWFANLDLTGDPATVAEGYRTQLNSQGFTMVRDEILADGTLSMEAHGLETPSGAGGEAPVDVYRIDVIPPTADVPGYVRFIVTHMDVAEEVTPEATEEATS